MILYLDTSALVKLYVAEGGTEYVVAAVERASALVTGRITYAEARSAFARHSRAKGLARGDLRRVLRHLDALVRLAARRRVLGFAFSA